jgi:hypothetical protein
MIIKWATRATTLIWCLAVLVLFVAWNTGRVGGQAEGCNHPGASVTVDDVDITTVGAWQDIAFDVEIYDDGFHSSDYPHWLIVPEDGRYLITASYRIRLQEDVAWIAIRTNRPRGSNSVDYYEHDALMPQGYGGTITSVQQMTAGDVTMLSVRSDAGGLEVVGSPMLSIQKLD